MPLEHERIDKSELYLKTIKEKLSKSRKHYRKLFIQNRNKNTFQI